MNSKQISLLAAFLAAHVDFAVVGGMAVNAHGWVHATSDLDLFIRPTKVNARAVFRALRALGAPIRGFKLADLLDHNGMLRLGSEEDHIDLLASIGEMSFERVWRNHIRVEIQGLTVPFISKADLIQNKLQTGRLRDLADVEELSRLAEDEG